MAELDAKHRNALPSSAFGLPGERKYPLENASHARNALARASQQRNRGALSEAQYKEIVAKAHKRLGKSMADDATTPAKR